MNKSFEKNTNLVNYYDDFHLLVGENSYFVTEYCEQGNLKDIIKKGDLKLDLDDLKFISY